MRTIASLKEMQKAIQADVVWIGVSRELKKKGIDSSKVIIAATFPEDVSQEYWAIVTFDKKIYEFYYDWLNKNVSEGEIVEWHDFTDDPDRVYLSESVQDVIRHFDALNS
jgi:ribosomal protein L30E